jgi:hypothetical protein
VLKNSDGSEGRTDLDPDFVGSWSDARKHEGHGTGAILSASERGAQIDDLTRLSCRAVQERAVIR